jgi:hypothetical protein
MNAGPAIALIVVSSCRVILSLRLKARFECKRCQIGLIGSYRSGQTSGGCDCRMPENRAAPFDDKSGDNDPTPAGDQPDLN